MDGVFENQVRVRAYEIWMAGGQMHGQAHEHWVAAERDLTAASVAAELPKTRRAPAKAKAARGETAKAETRKAKSTNAKSANAKSTKAESTKEKAAAKAPTPRGKVAKAPKTMIAAKAGKAADFGSNAASA